MSGSYREGHVGALNRMQKRAAIFANNINKSGWENLAQLIREPAYAPIFKT